MVRKKIEIKPLEEKSKRYTTFTKRRNGLLKMTKNLCLNFDLTAAVFAFSKAGNCYVLGHPDVDAILERYEAKSSPALPSPAVGRVHGGGEAPPLTEVHKRIAKAIIDGRWEEAVAGLGFQELNEFYGELENIRRKVEVRERKTAAADMSTESSTSGTSGSGSF